MTTCVECEEQATYRFPGDPNHTYCERHAKEFEKEHPDAPEWPPRLPREFGRARSGRVFHLWRSGGQRAFCGQQLETRCSNVDSDVEVCARCERSLSAEEEALQKEWWKSLSPGTKLYYSDSRADKAFAHLAVRLEDVGAAGKTRILDETAAAFLYRIAYSDVFGWFRIREELKSLKWFGVGGGQVERFAWRLWRLRKRDPNVSRYLDEVRDKLVRPALAFSENAPDLDFDDIQRLAALLGSKIMWDRASGLTDLTVLLHTVPDELIG